MGRMNVSVIRYLESQDFRVLIAIEMGMRNHELVPLQLIAATAKINRGAVTRILVDLAKHSAVAHERGKSYDGYRLTTLGYDILALKTLSNREVIGSVGNQIGVGKESDIYLAGDSDHNCIVLKFHRLGRTSFRKLKEKRDYHKKRKSCSWLYLSSLAAAKEFAYLKALYAHDFPLPRPIDRCRHLVVMDLIVGTTLCHVQHVSDAEELYEKLMAIIVRLARYGLIHGDFNEFNIMLIKGEEPILIDLPQMVSMDHINAKMYFERDVNCVRTFFRKRFNYESELYPKFEEMKRKHNLDVEVRASGFTSRMAKDFIRAVEVQENDASSTTTDEGSSVNKSSDAENSDQSFDTDEVKESVFDGNHSDRSWLNSWLKEAQDELEKLHTSSLLDDNLCDCDIETAKRSAASVERNVSMNSEVNEPHDCVVEDKEEGIILSDQNKMSTRSVFSIGSTIAPEIVRKRVAAEAKLKDKVPLRVKGKASAAVRQKKTNADIIKEFAIWDF